MKFSYIKMIWELGKAVFQAIKSGQTDKTVFDVLPAKYKDAELLKKLEDKARKDYAK